VYAEFGGFRLLVQTCLRAHHLGGRHILHVRHHFSIAPPPASLVLTGIVSYAASSPLSCFTRISFSICTAHRSVTTVHSSAQRVEFDTESFLLRIWFHASRVYCFKLGDALVSGKHVNPPPKRRPGFESESPTSGSASPLLHTVPGSDTHKRAKLMSAVAHKPACANPNRNMCAFCCQADTWPRARRRTQLKAM
jgi:hypothetical protein